MVKLCLVMMILVLGWGDAGHLPPATPPRPSPTEPDAPKHPTPTPTPGDVAPRPPLRYRLADASGQVWEHADPAQLQAFVADRNSRMVPRFAPVGCSTGQCPRP